MYGGHCLALRSLAPNEAMSPFSKSIHPPAPSGPAAFTNSILQRSVAKALNSGISFLNLSVSIPLPPSRCFSYQAFGHPPYVSLHLLLWITFECLAVCKVRCVKLLLQLEPVNHQCVLQAEVPKASNSASPFSGCSEWSCSHWETPSSHQASFPTKHEMFFNASGHIRNSKLKKSYRYTISVRITTLHHTRVASQEWNTVTNSRYL